MICFFSVAFPRPFSCLIFVIEQKIEWKNKKQDRKKKCPTARDALVKFKWWLVSLFSNLLVSHMSGNDPFLQRCLDTSFKLKYLTEDDVKTLCMKAKEILEKEDNVQCVNSPVTLGMFFFSRSLFTF